MNAETTMKTPPVVTAAEWEAARQRLLAQEKELTRARDALAAQRRRMPWLEVEKPYEFAGPAGPVSLLELFGGRRQLVIYRAFFEPGVVGWPDHACHGCSMMADQVADVVHLNARDTTFVYASRAPQPDIARLKERMGNRGDEALGSTWSYLDLTALGRQEEWEDSPEGYPQSAPYDWWNWHDEYDHPELAQGPLKRRVAAEASARGEAPGGCC
jgi:predicted dithiol-disulfide oxidoreductase (DUF899 family)